MNDDFTSLYTYNRWADRRVLEACRKLTPEQYAAEPSPGWSSVRSSIVHIAVVTEGWTRGLAGEDVHSFPSEEDLPSVDDAERVLDRAYQMFNEILISLTFILHMNSPHGGQRRPRGVDCGRSPFLPPQGIEHLQRLGGAR
jgi:uncharacterized damage-inducible protein DinB